MTQQGMLEILPAGTLPPDASEFLASPSMTRLLAQLSERADLLIIDTPPVLPVSDALALSPRVDAVVVITRLGEIRRSALNELARLLEAAPIVKMGFIVTGVGSDEDQAYGGYGYGYGYGYGGYGNTTEPVVKTPDWVPRRLRRGLRRSRWFRKAPAGQPAPFESAAPAPKPAPPVEAVPVEPMPVQSAAPAPAAPVSSHEEEDHDLMLRTVNRAKIKRALELFNRSEHATEIAGVARSVAPPKANARVWDSASAEVMLTVAWQGVWYQFVIDLSDTEDAVRMWSSGNELEKLPARFKEWNVLAQSNGGLKLVDQIREELDESHEEHTLA